MVMQQDAPERVQAPPVSPDKARADNVETAPPLAGPGAGKTYGTVMMGVGLIVFLVSVGISLVTYTNAREEGGTYVVLWGPALLGLVLCGVALVRLARAGFATRPQWHADPTGRHERRYWDGAHWTDRVSDHGHEGTDPTKVGGAQ